MVLPWEPPCDLGRSCDPWCDLGSHLVTLGGPVSHPNSGGPVGMGA